VTIHEFGHQYFYGLLASNEAEEAWLDEGLNSYLETHVMDSTYGRGSVLDIPGLELSDTHLQIFSYVAGTPDRGPLYRRSWEYDTEQDYGVSSYAKPATVMHSLAGYVGWETMVEILRTYYDRWAFRHPTTRDFQDVVEDVADEDMDWFFDQYVYGEVTVDYEVYSVSSERKWRADSTMQYQHELQLHRLGSGYFPVDIEITFADGTTSTVAWDGQSVWKFHTLTSSQPITQVWIDPSRSIALELTPLDNRWTSTANEAWPREVMLIVQYWVSAFVWLFGLFA
jgi:aminopeptidase N